MANRVKEDEKNERIIRNLLKLSENRRCINCNSLGPQYVCTNFSTFICTTCSGLHREFTHRVKSVSMAKFTPQEVSALQGGGNASAREIYLKEWDAQRNSLPDGSNIERLRDFIKHVYVDRRFTGEKNVEKPPRVKMGEIEDSNGNRRMDNYGSRSPPYDDRNSDKRSSGGRSPAYDQDIRQTSDYKRSSGGKSPAYDQDNRQTSDYRRSPAHAEVVTDWTREDRFGNGRRSEDRSSDGGSRVEIRSPDSQRDSDISSPPVVRPVRDILGENVSPLRVIEPPKATGVKPIDGRAFTQRTASSSSLASSDANPPEVKVVEASLIDFDAVPEPPVAVQQPLPAGNASNSNNWANFDSVPEVKTNTVPSNSVESLLSGLSIPASSSAPSAHLGNNISPFQPSDLLGSSSFGSTSLPPVGPTGIAPASSLGPAANAGGNMFTNAPTGGQWPTMNPQHHSMFPGGIAPPVTGGSVTNKPWNPIAPNAHGAPGAPVQVDGQFGGRKALAEDLFTMNYSYPAPAWYSGSPYGAGGPMHYNAPMAVPPNFQAVSKSSNPFDVGSEPSPLQPATFPSMASLQGALPNAATPPGLLHTSNYGAQAHHPSSLHSQTPSYAPTIPPSSFMGQEVAGSTAPRPQGLSGFSFEESPFASFNPNPQAGGFHSAPSNFTTNPFG